MGQIIKRPLALGGVGIILIFAAVYLIFYPLHILSVKDISTNKTVLETATSPGDNLWIVFINSVEGLPVADHFVVNDNYEFLFTETIFQAPYAGYVRAEREELIAPGTTRISGYNRQMEEITFYAGYTSKHMLFLNGNWLPLYEVAQGGDIIRITIRSNSRLASLLKRISNDR
ncbi:MAG: DUF1850 domain-containing protein [Desulfobacteraceae bacterium]|nr:MAG: DUF1850 domain-containing protein [Desulfobacteraceae bacterium]